jgi:hypothetical protein
MGYHQSEQSSKAMKPHLILGFLLMLVSMGFAQSTAPLSASDKTKLDSILDNITNRVRGGDYSALNEVATMPASVAVPYLHFWIDPGNAPQLKAATQAFRQVQGAADYLKQDMSDMTAQGSVPVNDFGLLELIGTSAAAAVVAPYLFDFKTTLPQDGDVAGDSNVGEAIYTLERMKLSGAPSPQPPEMSNAADLIAWQKWAISKGYVPSSWVSKIGAPKWMLELDAAEGLTHPSVAATIARPVQIMSSPDTVLSNSSVPMSTASSPPVQAATGTGGSRYVRDILVAVVFVLLVTGGILGWKTRK